MVSSAEIFAISFWIGNGTEHEAQHHVIDVMLGFLKLKMANLNEESEREDIRPCIIHRYLHLPEVPQIRDEPEDFDSWGQVHASFGIAFF